MSFVSKTISTIEIVPSRVWLIRGLFKVNRLDFATRIIQECNNRRNLGETFDEEKVRRVTLSTTTDSLSLDNINDSKNATEVMEMESLLFDTNCVVVKISSGLVLFNPLRPDEKFLESIKEIWNNGEKAPVAALVSGNLKHYAGLAACCRLFPNATLFIPKGLVYKLENKLFGSNVPEEDVTLLRQRCSDSPASKILVDFGFYELIGDKNMEETLFYDTISDTLIATDAYYSSYKEDDGPDFWFPKFFFDLFRPGGSQSESIPSYRMIDDRNAFWASLEALPDAKFLLAAHGCGVSKCSDQSAKQLIIRAWASFAPDH